MLYAASRTNTLIVLVVCIGVLAGCAGSSGRNSAQGASAPPDNSAVTIPTTPTTASAPPAARGLVPAVVGLPPNPSADQAYRIGPNDLIKINVFQVPELSSEERVDEQGNVNMPLVGEINIGSLTPQEAEARIAARLAEQYLQDPQVDVYVESSASLQITVMGNVRKPGVFPISGQTTLLQAIAMAEGLDPLAKEQEVVVFRSGGQGAISAYIVDVGAIQKGELADPILVADDRVVVPESGAEAFIKGVSDTLRGFVRLPPLY